MLAVRPATDEKEPSPRLAEAAEPTPGPDEVLIAVGAAGVNHADLLQLGGAYPPPPGESDIPGLECAGTIVELGADVEGWRRGDRVMALVAGGAQAERVAVPRGQLVPMPAGLGFAEAAAVPEAALTAWTNLVAEGALAAGEAVLVTGATGGVGTFAVQVARELGARVLASARDHGRLERLAALGIDERLVADDRLPAAVRAATDRGADLVLDLVGGELLDRHLAALREGGLLVLVGLLAGRRAPVDLAAVLRRRLRIVGSVLRARSRAEKASLVNGFRAFADGRLADGRLRPVVDRVLPFRRIAEAYDALARGGLFGKVVVEIGAS